MGDGKGSAFGVVVVCVHDQEPGVSLVSKQPVCSFVLTFLLLSCWGNVLRQVESRPGGICCDIRNRDVLSWEHGHACPSQHLVNRCQLWWQRTIAGLSMNPKWAWLV